MEINFQQHNQISHVSFAPTTRPTKPKHKPRTTKSNGGGSSSSSLPSTTRYVGVRQRPSGRWVAEIKDTTQKIRMWLGTFETAEAAARAYDEAACLLRGSNTRTNFAITNTQISNSPLASRIRNLLNHRKQQAQKKKQIATPSPHPPPPPPPPPPATPVLPVLPPQPMVEHNLMTTDFDRPFHELGMLEMDLSWMYSNGGIDDCLIPAASSREVTPLEEIMVPKKMNEISVMQETCYDYGSSIQNQEHSEQQQPSFFHLFCHMNTPGVLFL